MTRAFANLFRHRTTLPCASCGSDCLCPMSWEPDGKEYWVVEARCGDCETWHSLHLTNAQAAAWKVELARQARPIQRAVEQLDRERMAREVDGFVGALERDLIDAGDFA
jgi:hypothetical protein